MRFSDSRSIDEGLIKRRSKTASTKERLKGDVKGGSMKEYGGWRMEDVSVSGKLRATGLFLRYKGRFLVW